MTSQLQGLPEDFLFLFLGAGGTDDKRSGGDAYSHLQRFVGWQLDLTHGRHQIESRPDCAFSIVFMGVWIAEIGEHPIAHEPGNTASIIGDYRRAGRLKPADHCAEVFGIELNSERRRTYDIAKQYRKMASLLVGIRYCDVCERRTRWERRTTR